MTDTFDLVLRKINRLSSTTLDFRFESMDGHEFKYLPGQFYRFLFKVDGHEIERSYSICTYGDEVGASPFLDLVISYVDDGRASQYLFAAEEGIRCRVSGPYGRLLIPTILPDRLVLVATSVGIAPFMPMLWELFHDSRYSKLGIELVFGIRSPEEFLYKHILLGFAQRDNISIRICYSQEFPKEPKAYDYDGRVQIALAALDLEPETDHVLLCGNPFMIDEVYADLKLRGFRVRNVVREKYVFARETKTAPKPVLSDEDRRLLDEKLKKFRK